LKGQPPAPPPLILLVDTDRELLERTEKILSDEGYEVVAVSSFQEAKRLLDSLAPDLMIANVRLDAFNGLHLAARSRSDHATMPVIITSSWPEPVLEIESLRQGATFVVAPLTNPAFLGLVRTRLEQRADPERPIRRWPRKQLSGVRAQLAATPVRIFDVSYGGLRLAFEAEQNVPEVIDITVPGVGLTVQARPVWTHRSTATDELWCGAEVVDPGAAGLTEWREFVDTAQSLH
jgi:DNA-binding response OmpR family regulator